MPSRRHEARTLRAHVAAFYPYANPQQPLIGGATRADGEERGPAPAGKAAALAIPQQSRRG
jgi:hypothetical protein